MVTTQNESHLARVHELTCYASICKQINTRCPGFTNRTQRLMSNSGAILCVDFLVKGIQSKELNGSGYQSLRSLIGGNTPNDQGDLDFITSRVGSSRGRGQSSSMLFIFGISYSLLIANNRERSVQIAQVGSSMGRPNNLLTGRFFCFLGFLLGFFFKFLL